MEKDFATLRLLFTRHGETENNSKGTICGQQPGVLTKLGKEQPQKIGVFFNSHPIHFDHIYVSDLGRTKATFDNIKLKAPYLEKIPTTFTSVIREKSGGVLEGKPLGIWKQMADKEGKDLRAYKCEKGESWMDVNERCRKFLRLLVEEHIINNKNVSAEKEQNVFAVAHGGLLMEFHNVVNFIAEKKEGVFKNTAKNCSFH